MARTKKLDVRRKRNSTNVTSDFSASNSQHCPASRAKPSVKAANKLKACNHPRGKRRTAILLRILQEVKNLLTRCLSSRKSLTIPAFHIQDLMQQVLGTIRNENTSGMLDFYTLLMSSSQTGGFEGDTAPKLAEKILQVHGNHKKQDTDSDATEETLVFILGVIKLILHHSLKKGTPNLEDSAVVILGFVGQVLTTLGVESWHRILRKRIK